jgi:hypothetical protein
MTGVESQVPPLHTEGLLGLYAPRVFPDQAPHMGIPVPDAAPSYLYCTTKLCPRYSLLPAYALILLLVITHKSFVKLTRVKTGRKTPEIAGSSPTFPATVAHDRDVGNQQVD